MQRKQTMSETKKEFKFEFSEVVTNEITVIASSYEKAKEQMFAGNWDCEEVINVSNGDWECTLNPMPDSDKD